MATISLIPLTSEHHADALQQVYAATPRYWQLYEFDAAPSGQALRDLREAESTEGRTLLGIVQRLDPRNPQAGGELIGLIDFRLQWPEAKMAYLGMLMISGPYQRQKFGAKAWLMLKPWLAREANVATVRLGVEQFNPGALTFFQRHGFVLTGDSDRVKVGERLVRMLYMEQKLTSAPDTSG